MSTSVANHRSPLDSAGLGPALLAAVLLHGTLIFGLGFTPQSADTNRSNRTLEVTLTRQPSSRPPDQADSIAAQDQLGSGDHPQADPQTSQHTPQLDDSELRDTSPLTTPAPPPAATNTPDRAVLSTRGESPSSLSAPAEEPISSRAPQQHQKAEQIASLRARLDSQTQTYQRLPRTLILTASSARAAEEADYLYRWIEWVERIGNDNYPEEIRRQQLAGTLRLAVTLNRDGSVAEVEILHSSGQPTLDQAAVRIARLAAPFTPIPDTLHVDRIEMIRTWHFIPGQDFTTRAQ